MDLACAFPPGPAAPRLARFAGGLGARLGRLAAGGATQLARAPRRAEPARERGSRARGSGREEPA